MASPEWFAEDVVELTVIGVELDGAVRERDDDPVVAIAAGRGISVPATGLFTADNRCLLPYIGRQSLMM